MRRALGRLLRGLQAVHVSELLLGGSLGLKSRAVSEAAVWAISLRALWSTGSV